MFYGAGLVLIHWESSTPLAQETKPSNDGNSKLSFETETLTKLKDSFGVNL